MGHQNMDIPDSLLTLFSGRIERRNGEYVVQIPEHEMKSGDLEEGDTYRVAVYPSPKGSARDSDLIFEQQQTGPPVEEGDILDVEIEDMGKEGDGIARIGQGYVLFVEDAEVGEQVTVEVRKVQRNFGFAEIRQ